MGLLLQLAGVDCYEKYEFFHFFYFRQKSAPVTAEEDVDLFASDEDKQPAAQKPALVKPASKPVAKAPKQSSDGKAAKPAAVEKAWNNKAECEDAERKLQERLAQVMWNCQILMQSGGGGV